MFAMLVGTPPFETKSLGRTYAKITANEYEIPERLSASAKTFISALLHPDPKCRGHLHQPGHPSDVLSHVFFQCGFTPRKLPPNAVNQPPILPLDSVMTSTASGLEDVPDHGSSPTGSNHKFRLSLRQKLSSCLSPNLSQNLTLNGLHHDPEPCYGINQPQYRPADHLISLIIDALTCWVSRRPQQQLNLIDEGSNLAPSISVVPIFVTKWIDYSNKYGFGYQLSDKSVGVLFNGGTRICQTSLETEQCFEFTNILGKKKTLEMMMKGK